MSVIGRPSMHDALPMLFIRVGATFGSKSKLGIGFADWTRSHLKTSASQCRASRLSRSTSVPGTTTRAPSRQRFRPFRSSHRDMHALSTLNPGHALAARSALATTASRPGKPSSRAVVRQRGRTTKVFAAASSSDESSRAVSRVNVATVACTSLAAGLAAAMPALAEEAASAAAEISPFAGVVDITVLGVVGLLAVQGNKKAEAAKAAGAGKGAKGKKKR